MNAISGCISLREPTYQDYLALYPDRFTDNVVYWADLSKNDILSLDDYATGRLIRLKSASFLERIICLGQTPIGTITARDIDYKKKNCLLSIVIVREDCWGKGYGTTAIKLFFAELRFRDILHVFLETFSNNKRARSAFMKCGFKPRKKFYAPRSGRLVIYMEANLEPYKTIGYVVKPVTDLSQNKIDVV